MKHQWWIIGICAVILLGAAALCFRLNTPQTVVTVETYQPNREIQDMSESDDAGSESEEAERSRQKAGGESDGEHTQKSDSNEAGAEPAETKVREPVYDLNAAAKEDLMRVEGIGEALADAIIAYRTAIGGFTRRRELTEIRGIGENLSVRIMEEFYIPDELPPDMAQKEPEQSPAAESCSDIEEAETPSEPASEIGQTEQPVLHFELNAVTYEQLMMLPDMKPEWAAGIIDVREKAGGYYNMEELNLVKGLPPDYAEYKLREYLYLEESKQ
ncbi:MAG: helix-hairpin-helix domain-containing protein [Oscillospiraceae bacterium]|nr:helix-hairpin-helix domain-containing protein [Oscillospiraceae bacterium]